MAKKITDFFIDNRPKEPQPRPVLVEIDSNSNKSQESSYFVVRIFTKEMKPLHLF
jgi:hypothetical protein